MKLFTRFFLEGEGGEGGSNGGGGTLLGKGVGGGDGGSPTPPVKQGDGEGGTTAWDFRSALDDKGNFKAGWDASLPDDLKPSAASLAKYPNPLELMRGHANAAKLIGQKSAPLKAPAPDAKPEEIAKWNEQVRGILGIPATPEEYKIAKPESMPQGLSWNESEVGEFAKLAHSLNIPPAAAQKLVEFDMQRMQKLNATGEAKLDEFVKSQEAELRKDWGADFEVNLGLAAKAAQVVGFDLNDGELANNAKFVKAMLTVSRMIKPDALVGSDKSSSIMDGKAQAEDIRRNTNNPWHAAYMGKEGPSRQQEAAALMMRLQGVKS